MTVRVGTFEDGPRSLDHETTWLLGHTERITFGEPWFGEGDLYVDATLHVGCKFLQTDGSGARCRAFGYAGALPPSPRKPAQPRQLGDDRFMIVERQRLQPRHLPAPRRSLPVAAGSNPCATAACRTSDHRRVSACCRDLQLEIMCTRRQTALEALVRSRQSPYLCKVEREGDYSLGVEMISACGYLDLAGSCTLHGRRRRDGRPAKPDLCSEWPSKDPDQVLHPGCVFAPRRR